MEFVKKEKNQQVLWLTLNREKSLNALCPALVEELAAAVEEAEKEEEIRVIVITGAGKAFVAGADISYMKDLAPFAAHS